MSAETQRWIEAGKAIALDSNAKVKCPRFEDDFLLVEDVRNPQSPDELERIMKCPRCGAMNVLRLRRTSE
jgi:phage FluMu protein Com